MADGVLRLELLGDLRVSRDGRPLTEALPRKGLALLAYLAVTARPQRRERLAGLLWGDTPDEAARGSLRKALAILREHLGPALLATRATVALDPNFPLWCDVTAFEAALRQPDDEAPLAAALALYTGDLLADLALPDADPFEEWALARRAHLRERALAASRQLAQRQLARQATGEAIGTLRRLLRLEPWDDEAHRLLVAALAQDGQPGAARAHHATYRRRLVAELGLDPDAAPPFREPPPQDDPPPRAAAPPAPAERGDAAATPRRRATDVPPDADALPADLTPFVGRGAELAAVLALLERGARLVTLIGLGGSGKTRLGLTVARALAARGEAVAFVPLASLGDPTALPATIAAALGLAYRDGDAERAVLEGLRARRLLLLLDNFEHLRDAATFVASLLAAVPRLRVLVTSREPLQLYGEQRYEVGGLALARDATLAAAREAAAVQLFVASAIRARADFTLDEDTLPGVLRLCTLVAGLPLGLELAAAQLDVLSPDAIAAELARSTDALTVEWRDLPERQRSIRAVFDWSWRLLNEAEQRALRRLAIFRGGFTGAAAAAAAATPRDLAALVRKSLVQRSDADATDGRYELHELVRQFAAEYLDAAPDERTATEARHGAYFLALAEATAPKMLGSELIHGLALFDREIGNLRVALAWAKTSADPCLSLRLAGALSRYWAHRGQLGEGRAWLEQAVSHPGSDLAQADIRAEAYLGLGLLSTLQGDHTSGSRWLECSIALFREVENPVAAVRALTTLAGVLYNSGAMVPTIALLERCVAAAREIDHQGELCRALMNLGDAYCMLDDLTNAEHSFYEALYLARMSGRATFEALTIGCLGTVARQRGQLDRAMALQRHALAYKWDWGEQRLIASGLEEIASIYALSGDGDAAARLLGAAAALRAAITTPQPLPERQVIERLIAPVQATLGEEGWARAFAAGQALPLEAVIAEILGTHADESADLSPFPQLAR